MRGSSSQTRNGRGSNRVSLSLDTRRDSYMEWCQLGLWTPPSLSVRGASDETEGNKVRIIGSLLERPIDWITQRDSSQRRGALLWLLGSISVSG